MSSSAVKQDLELETELSDEQLQIGIRRLAKIRANFKAIQAEITEKILDGVQSMVGELNTANAEVGELNAALRTDQK